MLTFACKDAGMDCSFVATGSTIEEVKQAAFAHAEVVHRDVLSSMTPKQQADLVFTVESKIKPS